MMQELLTNGFAYLGMVCLPVLIVLGFFKLVTFIEQVRK